MPTLTRIVNKLLGRPEPQEEVVDRVITSLERGQSELDRRLNALRAQVAAQTHGREQERPR